MECGEHSIATDIIYIVRHLLVIVQIGILFLLALTLLTHYQKTILKKTKRSLNQNKFQFCNSQDLIYDLILILVEFI